jgi:hypothetical protein
MRRPFFASSKKLMEVSSFLTFSKFFAMIPLISNFPQKPYPWVLESGPFVPRGGELECEVIS